jgi:hypothetical protein
MSKFSERAKIHDELETSVMNIIRPFTDRRHLPDRRISFKQVPVSFDIKTTIFVEENSHDEYFRLWDEGEQVFIVYKNLYNPHAEILADWIINLAWSGPYPPSPNSTSGDPYYKISGGKPLMEFLKSI